MQKTQKQDYLKLDVYNNISDVIDVVKAFLFNIQKI